MSNLRKLEVKSDLKVWNCFWVYFEHFWLRPRDQDGFLLFEMWNTGHSIKDSIDLTDLTNNCLEGYNGQLNRSFPQAHPKLLPFVKVLLDKSIMFSEIHKIKWQGLDKVVRNKRRRSVPIIMSDEMLEILL